MLKIPSGKARRRRFPSDHASPVKTANRKQAVVAPTQPKRIACQKRITTGKSASAKAVPASKEGAEATLPTASKSAVKSTQVRKSRRFNCARKSAPILATIGERAITPKACSAQRLPKPVEKGEVPPSICAKRIPARVTPVARGRRIIPRSPIPPPSPTERSSATVMKTHIQRPPTSPIWFVDESRNGNKEATQAPKIRFRQASPITTPTSGSRRGPWLPPKKISLENQAIPPMSKPRTISTNWVAMRDGHLESFFIELRIKHFLFPFGKLIMSVWVPPPLQATTCKSCSI